ERETRNFKLSKSSLPRVRPDAQLMEMQRTAKGYIGQKRRKPASTAALQTSEVVVLVLSGGLWFEQAGGLAPRSGLPVVFAPFGGNPGRETLVEIGGQRVDVRLVHVAQLAEAGVGGFAVVEFQTVLREDFTDMAKFCGRKTILRKPAWRCAEDL